MDQRYTLIIVNCISFKGRLVGHFYDEAGQETAALKDFQSRLNEAKSAKLSDEDDKNRFPPCNFEYKQGQGRRIWCSTLRWISFV